MTSDSDINEKQIDIAASRLILHSLLMGLSSQVRIAGEWTRDSVAPMLIKLRGVVATEDRDCSHNPSVRL